MAARDDSIMFVFLSTLSLRRATPLPWPGTPRPRLFLSTLSLRRATSQGDLFQCPDTDFYPRSPCGERPHIHSTSHGRPGISIHALLAESDIWTYQRHFPPYISIHALLAESDVFVRGHDFWPWYFYPRSPCGERLSVVFLLLAVGVFLSTLSLRRATAKVHKTVGHFCAYETNFMGIASSC